jgi:hypothetical protein
MQTNDVKLLPGDFDGEAMSTNNLKWRAELAMMSLTSLVRYNQTYLRRLEITRFKWMFSTQVFSFLQTRKCLKLFHNLAIDLIGDGDLDLTYEEYHHFLCEVRDVLEWYKPHFLKMETKFPNHLTENPEDLFNIITFGGKL